MSSTTLNCVGCRWFVRIVFFSCRWAHKTPCFPGAKEETRKPTSMQITQQIDSRELFSPHVHMHLCKCIYANAGTLFCIDDALLLVVACMEWGWKGLIKCWPVWCFLQKHACVSAELALNISIFWLTPNCQKPINYCIKLIIALKNGNGKI